MAVIQNNKDDKDKKEMTSNVPGVTSAPMGTSPTSPNQQKTSSGRFTNITNYIRANQGGNQLASNISSNIQKSGQDVRQSVGQAANQFMQKAEQGRLNKAQVLPEAQGIIQRAGTGAEGDVERFRRISQGTYQGPQSLDNAAVLQSRAAEVEGLGRNLMTSAGRQATLGQMYGGSGGYSSGQRRLDDLLIGGSQELRRARGMAAGLGRQAGQETQRAQNLAQFFGREAAEVGQESQQLLSDARTTEDTNLNQRLAQVAEEEEAARALIDQTLADIKAGRISRQALENLGIQDLAGKVVGGIDKTFGDISRQAGATDVRSDGSVGYGGWEGELFGQAAQAANDPSALSKLYTFGVDPTKYISGRYSEDPMTRETVASREQAARINALAKLAGFSTPQLNEQLAETFRKSQLQLDPEFEKALMEGRSNVENVYRQAETVRQAVINAKRRRDRALQLLNDTRRSETYQEVFDMLQAAKNDLVVPAAEYARLTGNANQVGPGVLGNLMTSLGIY